MVGAAGGGGGGGCSDKLTFEKYKKILKCRDEIKKYIPSSKLFVDGFKPQPLTTVQYDRLMWILYNCRTKAKLSFERMWKNNENNRDFLYILVTRTMSKVDGKNPLKNWEFDCVSSDEWNSKDYEKFWKESKKYPVIEAQKDEKCLVDKCLCGVKITKYFYCYNSNLKVTFKIGSVCSGHGTEIKRHCKECGKIEKRMATKGEYADLCKECKYIKEDYDSLLKFHPKDEIGKCIDCKSIFHKDKPWKSRCIKCYYNYTNRILIV